MGRRQALLAAASVVMVALGAGIPGFMASGPGPIVVLIVGLSGVPSGLNTSIESIGGRVLRTDGLLNFTVVATDDQSGFTSRALNLPFVHYVEIDRNDVKGFFTPNDPLFPQQWNFPNIRLPDSWDQVPTQNQSQVVVAVLDTGVDWNHPDIEANMWDGNPFHGFDLIPGSQLVNCVLTINILQLLQRIQDCQALLQPPLTSVGPMDFHGHGTHVAGIIGAVTNNSVGVAGGTQSQIMSVRVLITPSNPYNSVDAVASGIAIAAANGAHVISMSLGTPSNSTTLYNAVDYARSRGAVLVAAAGNDGNSGVYYPGGYPQVIRVSATNRTDERWPFSNFGETIDVAAPGFEVTSLQAEWTVVRYVGYVRVGHGYTIANGTSQATPHVSALAALLLAKNPMLTNLQVKTLIECTADDIGLPGKDNDFGWGRVNATRAIARAAVGSC